MSSIIYNLISKETLKELARAFYSCIGLSVVILDENGEAIESCGEKPVFCEDLCKCLGTREPCRIIHKQAGERALLLGDAYIYSCHAGLSLIAFPLSNKNVLYGSVLVGPFIMDELSSDLVQDVGKVFPQFSTAQLLQLYDDSFSITSVEPSKVTQIARLIYYVFAGMVTDSREKYVINQQKVHQQSMISESIQLYKTGEHSPDPNFPYEKEQQLIAKMKTGNMEEAEKILNELLAFLISNQNFSVDTFRNRAVEISSVLTRAMIGNGASQRTVFEINDFFLSRVWNYKNVDDICYVLRELLVSYNKCMFPISGDSGSRQVREAMNFIASRFYENITLKDVASEVCLNETYFSRLFHQATGLTFKDYLTKVRIDEAKRLLKNTEYQLLEIAIAIGYNDQSYFSRIFKAKTGMSPSDYRNS